MEIAYIQPPVDQLADGPLKTTITKEQPQVTFGRLIKWCFTFLGSSIVNFCSKGNLEGGMELLNVIRLSVKG